LCFVIHSRLRDNFPVAQFFLGKMKMDANAREAGEENKPENAWWSKCACNTIQYNTLLTTPHRGFSVTIQNKQ